VAAELADADPKALVPGNPVAVWELSYSIGSVAGTLEDIGLGLRTIDDGGWRGPAANAFHASFGKQPKRFLVAADAFSSAAGALDEYALALSWAQRQAGEAVALARAESPAEKPKPLLTAAQQAEQTGVLAYNAELTVSRPAPLPAADTLRRARVQLDVIGHEVAAKLRTAGELAPRPVEPWQAVHQSLARPAPGLVPAIVLPAMRVDFAAHHPEADLKRHLDHDTLRDNPARWEAGLLAVRRRLRLGLDQLSPRLKQHVFEGQFKTKGDVGYHHREGGVDRGAFRVVRVLDGPDRHGVYVAQVTRCGEQVKRSTFFPDSWSRHDVLHAIRRAFADRHEYNPASRKWTGEYNGMHIRGYVENRIANGSTGPGRPRLYHVVTAYPLLRKEERP
jgi:hypothetical protein